MIIIFYGVFAFIVLSIFNTMTHSFCQRMELNEMRTKKVYKVINMIMVTMLVCSYLRILNVAV
ncbi:hypothetical protein M3210_04750 [Oceanobacillus luteolus]|uniref:Uncharacterized protein n=1 Tax=Oceanobacillus luteolus TaxID=1274358 RepID=A0ABW4HTR5_9BACI|nr:hypothetical protein [Oceanobacillus luteolus]MCM3739574.1 hypothetical protein [Oceanobacillus luteolus]